MKRPATIFRACIEIYRKTCRRSRLSRWKMYSSHSRRKSLKNTCSRLKTRQTTMPKAQKIYIWKSSACRISSSKQKTKSKGKLKYVRLLKIKTKGRNSPIDSVNQTWDLTTQKLKLYHWLIKIADQNRSNDPSLTQY